MQIFVERCISELAVDYSNNSACYYNSCLNILNPVNKILQNFGHINYLVALKCKLDECKWTWFSVLKRVEELPTKVHSLSSFYYTDLIYMLTTLQPVLKFWLFENP